MFENERDGSLATFRKVMKYIGQYKILLFISVILAGVSVITTLYAPILFGDAIDCIVEKGTSFGISQFDYIVLNSADVEEEEITVKG